MGCGSSSASQKPPGDSSAEAPQDAGAAAAKEGAAASLTSSSTWSSTFFEKLVAVYVPPAPAGVAEASATATADDDDDDDPVGDRPDGKDRPEDRPEKAMEAIPKSDERSPVVDVSGLDEDKTDWLQLEKTGQNGPVVVEAEGSQSTPAASASNASLTGVVRALTQDLQGEVAKALALFRWLGEYIQYTGTSPGDTIPGDDTATGALDRRLADADGFSKAYAYLCNFAAINCHPVYGLCKSPRYGYYPGYPIDPANPRQAKCAHAWNAVQLNGSWYLCDVTWAAGFMDAKSNSEWDERWFMADPKAFLATHLPYDNVHGVRRRKQLVPKPVRSLHEWNSTPALYPQSQKYNLQLVSHQSGVIATKNPNLSLILSVSVPSQECVKYSADLKDPTGACQYSKNWTMVYAVNSKIQIETRLPGKGKYLLALNAIPLDKESLAEQETLPLLLYTIESECESSGMPFPAGTGCDWGVLPQCAAAGIDVLSPQAPVFHTSGGVAIIRVRLPTDAPFPNGHTLHHRSATAETLAAFVYAERIGQRGIYHIQCPFPGEYRFEVLVGASEKPPDLKLSVAAAFLVVCDEPVSEPNPYGKCSEFAGLKRPFHAFDLSTTVPSSTFRLTPQVDDAVGHLQFNKTRPVSVSARLLSTYARLDSGKLLLMTAKTDVKKIELWPFVSFLVTAPNKGNHLLELFASEPDQEDSAQLVAVYSVQST